MSENTHVDALHAALRLLDLAELEAASQEQAQLLHDAAGLIEEALDNSDTSPTGAA